MRRPFVAADGFSYEEDLLRAWLRDHATSPMTNDPLPSTTIVPNRSLRAAIEEWGAQRSLDLDPECLAILPEEHVRDAHTAEIEALRQTHAMEMQSIRDDLAAAMNVSVLANARAIAAESAVEDLKLLVEAAREMHAVKMHALRDSHAAEIRDAHAAMNARVLANAHDADVASMEVSALVEAIRNEHNAEMEAIRDAHAANVQAIRDAHAANVQALRESDNFERLHIRNEHNAEMEAIRDAHAANVQALRDSDNFERLHIREEFVLRLKTYRDSHAAELLANEEHLQSLQETHAAEVLDLNNKLAVALRCEEESASCLATMLDQVENAKTFNEFMREQELRDERTARKDEIERLRSGLSIISERALEVLKFGRPE
jgi:hypothetical protein